MKFTSINERFVAVPAAVLAEAMSTLSSKDDRLWPIGGWPRMRLDQGLEPGSKGGHGPIRYCVEVHEPGRFVQFRFLPATGFGGVHWFESISVGDRVCLRHVVAGEATLGGWLRWRLVFGPLHEALIQDAFDRAESLSEESSVARRRHSLYVRLLRRLLAPRA